MLYICVSFDYELFMGENKATEKEVLIDPAKEVADMLAKNGISATFFADVCSVWAYRNFGKEEYPVLFENQLKYLVNNNHDVQLHIHPHWLSATSVGAHVQFPAESYRLISINGNQVHDAAAVIHDGKEYLESLLKPVNPEYKCIAYRAGGFCAQPEKVLAKILSNEGILIDSSVNPLFYNLNDMKFFDYRDYAPSKNMYISDTLGFSDNSENRQGVFEVPIGCYDTKPYISIAKIKAKKKITDEPLKGSFAEKKVIKNDGNIILRKVCNMFTGKMNLSFDSYNTDTMCYLINRIAKESGSMHKDVFISTISHPKCLTDQHIANMQEAVNRLNKNPCIKFVSMKDISEQICNMLL